MVQEPEPTEYTYIGPYVDCFKESMQDPEQDFVQDPTRHDSQKY